MRLDLKDEVYDLIYVPRAQYFTSNPCGLLLDLRTNLCLLIISDEKNIYMVASGRAVGVQ